MLNLKGIDHINMRVTNLNESVRFYQQLFNFKEVEAGFSSSNERYKIIGTSRVAFLALYESNEPIKADHVGHIGFNITNFDEVLNTVK
ncbi:MAG: VOC family protein, partial [Halobacteriovoraceae bacterium]|nr:VOC family protein [Halobacteriovoraceae bacterium]